MKERKDRRWTVQLDISRQSLECTVVVVSRLAALRKYVSAYLLFSFVQKCFFSNKSIEDRFIVHFQSASQSVCSSVSQ